MVICPKPNPHARLRLFCFPFAGGGPATFNSWVDELPPDIGQLTELCSIQLPGRETKHSADLAVRLSPILEALTPALQSYTDIPFTFFGHSMGALVSFELARHLRRQGLPGPVHMVVSGHRAPQLPDPHPAIHSLPDAEFLARLRELGGTPEEVLQDPELMELFMPVLRADFAVCETYCYTNAAPLDCPISVFGANDDRKVSREELSAWRAQSSKSFSLRMFPGDHFFLLSSRVPVLLALAQELKQLFRRLSLHRC
jgi:surfactin synthase thioesterase subunit